MLLGHEAAGEVVDCGQGTEGWRPGDRVVLVFMPSCGDCLPCAEGRPALCAPGAAANVAGTLLAGGRRLRLDGRAIHHHLGCSAFAEYAVVSARSAVKYECDLSFAEAAMFGCAVLTGVGAVVNAAGVRAGQRVAVVGLGGVGLAALLGAVCAGASKVIAVDLVAEKLTLASRVGATHTFVASASDCEQAIREATDGGVEVAIETAGAPSALDLAYRITRRGGTTVTAGLPAPGKMFELSPAAMVGEERTLKGCYMGTTIPRRDIPRYMELYRRGRLPVDRLMSASIPLEAINEALDHLQHGAAIRQILVP
jgi:alcohol dehydrogenase